MRNYIHGVLVTCDRCGKKRFIRGNLTNYGWRDMFGKDICPKCNAELEEKIDDFMDVDDSELYFAMIDQFMKEKLVKIGEDVNCDIKIEDIFSKIIWEDCKNDKNSIES